MFLKFALPFREITFLKTFKLTGSFLCNYFVESETKVLIVSPNNENSKLEIYCKRYYKDSSRETSGIFYPGYCYS